MKKLDRLAALQGADRSTVLRAMLQFSLDNSPQAFLLLRRPGKGKGATGRVIGIAAAEQRAKAAQAAFRRTPSVENEINVQRAEEALDQVLHAEADRLSLRNARRLM